jgi:cystathionine beta-lyase family protein involved in aluminum resistance
MNRAHVGFDIFLVVLKDKRTNIFQQATIKKVVPMKDFKTTLQRNRSAYKGLFYAPRMTMSGLRSRATHKVDFCL